MPDHQITRLPNHPMIGSMVLTVRRMRRAPAAAAPAAHAPHAHGVDWVDIFAAGVLATEALERWHVKHQIARPTILTALVMLAMGVFDGRIIAAAEQRSALRVSPEGLRLGRRPFRLFRAGWGEIGRIDLDARWRITQAQSVRR